MDSHLFNWQLLQVYGMFYKLLNNDVKGKFGDLLMTFLYHTCSVNKEKASLQLTLLENWSLNIIIRLCDIKYVYYSH